jgi:hypothetical protein
MARILLLMLLPLSLIAQAVKTTKYTDAGAQFVSSLNETQRKAASFAFNDTTRYEWHYLPASQVKRFGLCIKELDSAQYKNLYSLLKAFLSEQGYKRSRDIMSYEYLLKELEPNNPGRIPENYFVSFYGNPLKDLAWSWRITGHHLALNYTVVNGQLAFAPFFFGVYPATVKSGPMQGRRLFKEEEDLGFDLINSMNRDQKAKAILQSDTYNDIVTRASIHVDPLEAKGIRAKEMSREQKMVLEKLILTYLSSMPQDIAQKRMSRVQNENFGDILFAWAGATTNANAHYYRIQGTTFLIEFDNSQANANHVHTVWRDFNGDFGADLLKEHYKEHKH